MPHASLRTAINITTVITISIGFMFLYRSFGLWGVGVGVALVTFLIAAFFITTFAVAAYHQKQTIFRVIERYLYRLASTPALRQLTESLKQRWPRMQRFLVGRFARAPQGLYMTLGLTISAFFLFHLIGTVRDVLFEAAVGRIDATIGYMAQAVALPTRTTWFVYLSILANTSTALVVTGCVSLYLFVVKNRMTIVYLVMSVATGLASTMMLKIVVDRARPEDLNLIVLPVSASFPSGHATLAVCLYGFCALIIMQRTRSALIKALTFVVTVFLLFSIGLSRVYLGVHYASDVLAGWYLGLTILFFMMTMWGVDRRLRERLYVKQSLSPGGIIRHMFLGAFLVSIVLVSMQRVYSQTVHLHPAPILHAVASVDEFVASANYYSENVIGTNMSPISIIIVGSEQQLRAAFSKTGWFVADPPTIRNLLSLSSAIANDAPYDTAPMTPSFYNGEPHVIGVEKPTSEHSARSRHHARFWHSNATLKGVPIWVGTASLDTGVGVGALRKIPTHKIDPNIDAERDFIRDELRSTGLTRSSTRISIVGPTNGTNAAGDHFYTDGNAYIIRLDEI